ncbi:hypothetical protein SeLEV6574_g06632 [Synchytrium endobioticum]|uniref:Uncharacterized protein n=1 Tax=Synchytrium endobioticum TaxID=286115 RepID=A0A507CMX9_9FUNG|nr:hypothetical protein SeLEV6574_g06632 [Synchytrium endobioticum]
MIDQEPDQVEPETGAPSDFVNQGVGNVDLDNYGALGGEPPGEQAKAPNVLQEPDTDLDNDQQPDDNKPRATVKSMTDSSANLRSELSSVLALDAKALSATSLNNGLSELAESAHSVRTSSYNVLGKENDDGARSKLLVNDDMTVSCSGSQQLLNNGSEQGTSHELATTHVSAIFGDESHQLLSGSTNNLKASNNALNHREGEIIRGQIDETVNDNPTQEQGQEAAEEIDLVAAQKSQEETQIEQRDPAPKKLEEAKQWEVEEAAQAKRQAEEVSKRMLERERHLQQQRAAEAKLNEAEDEEEDDVGPLPIPSVHQVSRAPIGQNQPNQPRPAPKPNQQQREQQAEQEQQLRDRIALPQPQASSNPQLPSSQVPRMIQNQPQSISVPPWTSSSQRRSVADNHRPSVTSTHSTKTIHHVLQVDVETHSVMVPMSAKTLTSAGIGPGWNYSTKLQYGNDIIGGLQTPPELEPEYYQPHEQTCAPHRRWARRQHAAESGSRLRPLPRAPGYPAPNTYYSVTPGVPLPNWMNSQQGATYNLPSHAKVKSPSSPESAASTKSHQTTSRGSSTRKSSSTRNARLVPLNTIPRTIYSSPSLLHASSASPPSPPAPSQLGVSMAYPYAPQLAMPYPTPYGMYPQAPSPLSPMGPIMYDPYTMYCQQQQAMMFQQQAAILAFQQQQYQQQPHALPGFQAHDTPPVFASPAGSSIRPFRHDPSVPSQPSIHSSYENETGDIPVRAAKPPTSYLAQFQQQQQRSEYEDEAANGLNLHFGSC